MKTPTTEIEQQPLTPLGQAARGCRGRLVVSGVAVSLGLIACSGAPQGEERAEQTAAALSAPGGRLLSLTNGRCLEVVGSGQSGLQVTLAPCNGSPAQTFTYPIGAPGPIANPASGLCLDDVFGAGIQFQMVTCDGRVEQQWTIKTPVSGQPAVVTASDSFGNCATASGPTTAVPAKCNGSTSQDWGPNPTCPAGHTWDFQTNFCISTTCATGYFFDAKTDRCECDPFGDFAEVSAEQFKLFVAPELTHIQVSYPDKNGKLDVTVPGQKPIAPSTVNNPALKSLAMPSSPSGTWSWTMDNSSATITVTTTLNAVVAGSGPFNCGFTASIQNANVTIVLGPAGPDPGADGLQVRSVSIPLDGNNTSVNGCEFTPRDDIRGGVQNGLQDGLQQQFDGNALLGPSGLLDTAVTALANVVPTAIDLPDGATTWSCNGSVLTSGAIQSECTRVCPPPQIVIHPPPVAIAP